MFIVVKYGSNETLICNPSCAIINLLTSIKRRAGYGNTNVTVDLSDETGLVKELDMHKHENANKYLTSHSTYILVQKEISNDNDSLESDASPTPRQYNYIPLLDKYDDLFPNYRLHVDHIPPKTPRKRMQKSPSPAGRFISSKSKKTEVAKKSTKTKRS